MLPRRGRRRRRGVTIPPVPAEALPLTAFCPRRGMPYTVAHGDDCEHLWVVRDMRAPVGGAGGDPQGARGLPLGTGPRAAAAETVSGTCDGGEGEGAMGGGGLWREGAGGAARRWPPKGRSAIVPCAVSLTRLCGHR